MAILVVLKYVSIMSESKAKYLTGGRPSATVSACSSQPWIWVKFDKSSNVTI